MNIYRKQGEVKEDMPDKSNLPLSANEVAILMKNEAEQACINAEKLWKKSVEPEVLSAMKKGKTKDVIILKSTHEANAMIKYGKSLGFKVEVGIGNENMIHVQWSSAPKHTRAPTIVNATEAYIDGHKFKMGLFIAALIMLVTIGLISKVW